MKDEHKKDDHEGDKRMDNKNGTKIVKIRKTPHELKVRFFERVVCYHLQIEYKHFPNISEFIRSVLDYMNDKKEDDFLNSNKSIEEIDISGRKLQAILDSTMTRSSKTISKYTVNDQRKVL